MYSENYDIIAYNFFWQAESIFKFLTALVEDVNICLQACSSLHALSSSLPDDLLQMYGLMIQSFDPCPNKLDMLPHLSYLFNFFVGVLMFAVFN